LKNSFRLKADAMFTRGEELEREAPLRILFLSVEGNDTERNYFEWVEKYREQLGIKAKVHVHSLGRAKNDNLSAPEYVLELLEEYIEVREAEILPERMRAVIPVEYTDEFIEQYIKNPETLDITRRKKFEILLRQAGIDIEYNYFLKEYSGKYDEFGVVIDRDYGTHSVTQMNEIRKQCEKKNYHFYITTPCIEFWLLMHLTDICGEYKDDIQKFRDNIRKSQKHTFTSYEVSKYAGHSKKISEEIFKKFYLPKIDYAIQQTKKYFTTNIYELIGTDETEDAKKGKLGSNLPDLFELLRRM